MIDPSTGMVSLPNGFVIGPSTSRGDLGEQSWNVVKGYDRGRLMWAKMLVGLIENEPASLSLSFLNERLVGLNVTVGSYNYGNFDLHIESCAVIKKRHDGILLQDLGEPHCRTCEDPGSDQPGLQEHLKYDYDWGSVVSEYDCGGGNSCIHISFEPGF